MRIDIDKLQRLIDQHWSKTDFAAASNMSRVTLNAILETGEIKKTKHLNGILDALNIPKEELVVSDLAITGNGNTAVVGSKSTKILSSKDLLNEYLRLVEENKELTQKVVSLEATVSAQEKEIAFWRESLSKK